MNNRLFDHNKTSRISFVAVAVCSLIFCNNTNGLSQNIGIGIASPTRARFEVRGTSKGGNTSALFGGQWGISLQRNYAAIGFNQYRDDSTANSNGKYMETGYAGVLKLVHDDPTLVEGLSLTMYPSGSANAQLGAGKRVWTFSANNRWRIIATGPANNTGLLDVARGTGQEGTAAFRGTAYHTYFNNGNDENTFIRGGKSLSNVYFNDLPGGKVIFGSGGTRIGLNTNYYVPTSITLEVRENVGGLRLVNSSYSTLTWEWRVPSGSPANYNLYYAGSLKNYFSYSDGSRHAVSDSRLKTNVVPLAPVLDKLMQLQMVTYRMKDNATDKQPSVGFIAQQVEPLFPLLVSHNMPGEGELLGLNYSGFGVVAIKGVQEEQAEIDRLTDLVAEAEKALQKLQAKTSSKPVLPSK